MAEHAITTPCGPMHLLSRDDVKVARREMEDANFTRDRLHEAGTKLAERVDDLKSLEADCRAGDEHERVLTERDRLADEMERMAEPIKNRPPRLADRSV